MLEPLSLPFVQRGLVQILVLAVGAGVIGTWIVLRGLAFFAHAVGTAAFPGLVLADGLGFAATLGAGATGAIVAIAVGVLARRPAARERYDSLTALVLVGALALGVILASDVFGSGSNVESLLFGSLLLVDGGDIALAGVASVVAVGLAALLEQRWLVSAFDPETAPALGARSALPDLTLLGIIALLSVAALATLGALLSTALLVVPAATTRLVCSRLRTWQLATVALVAVEGTVGLWLAFQTNTPPGAAIAVLAGATFALVAAGRALTRGLRARRAALAAAALLALALVGAGCGAGSTGTTDGDGAAAEPIKVVVTTTVLGDVVGQIGGDAADVTQILKPNADAHDYEPRPQDVTATADAELVVQSGDNLDEWMGDVVEQSGTEADVVDVSENLEFRLPGETEGEEASKYDPHWWHDPRNTVTAVKAVRDALSEADPGAKATYDANATAYLAKVRALDEGIADCFDKIPAEERKLVTDHDAFGYFAGRYDITVIGAVIPSQTTQAQASAGEIAKLARVIEKEGVKAVFPESSVNSKLAEAIADQTGASAEYELYGDSLGSDGSSGATYLTMEQANADAMVKGFTGGSGSCTIPEL
ncbi:MAG: zinc ABC transporter substrate-binding protein [Solirubrobacteraceae bacterium]